MFGWIKARLERRREEKKKQQAPIGVPKTSGSFIRDLHEDALVDMDGMIVGAVERTLARQAASGSHIDMSGPGGGSIAPARTAAPPAYVPNNRRQDDDDDTRRRDTAAPVTVDHGAAWRNESWDTPTRSAPASECSSRHSSSSSHSHSHDNHDSGSSSYSSPCGSDYADSGGGGSYDGGGGGSYD